MQLYILAVFIPAVFGGEGVHFHYPSTTWADEEWFTDGNLTHYCMPSMHSSPINIAHTNAIAAWDMDEDVDATAFLKIYILNKKYRFHFADTSTGHSLKFYWDTPLVGPKFTCVQFHLHVGASEHTLNSLHHFAEIHIVCHLNEFADLDEAAGSGNMGALVVFGIFFDVDEEAEDNPWFNSIYNAHQNNRGHAKNLRIPLSPDLGSYYRYEGSLTTPLCNEVVLWTVFKTPGCISSAQRDALMADFKPHLKNNNRAVQNTGNRTVTYYSTTSNLTNADGTVRPVRDNNMCLKARRAKAGGRLVLRQCNMYSSSFLWEFMPDGCIKLQTANLCATVTSLTKDGSMKLQECDMSNDNQKFTRDDDNVIRNIGSVDGCVSASKSGRVKFGYCPFKAFNI